MFGVIIVSAKTKGVLIFYKSFLRSKFQAWPCVDTRQTGDQRRTEPGAPEQAVTTTKPTDWSEKPGQIPAL